MKITTVTFVILLAAVNLSAAAASGSNQYNDAYETYEEGSYNEESQHVSVEEDDTFREYIVHEERFYYPKNVHSVGNLIWQFWHIISHQAMYRVTTINVSRIWIEWAEWAASLCTANSPFPGHVYCLHPVHEIGL